MVRLRLAAPPDHLAHALGLALGQAIEHARVVEGDHPARHLGRSRELLAAALARREAGPRAVLVAEPLRVTVDAAVTMFHGPTPPMAPTTGQLWLKEGVTPKWSVPWVTQKIFRWDGTQWLLHGHLRDEASISRQGKQECSFAEALAGARETARRNRLQIIYTFDDSTWGNA